MRQGKERRKAIELAAAIGLDWADREHHVCVVEEGVEGCEKSVVRHTPEALMEWVAGLRDRFGGRPVGICLEQSRGAVVYALMRYDFLILYPVNPSTLAKYREAFATSRAKDDPTDAELLAELLTHHRDRLRAWEPDDERTRTMRLLAEARRDAIHLRTQLSNKLTALLKGYFPQALTLVGTSVSSVLGCDFLLRWPTLEALQQASPEELRGFYTSHNSRSSSKIQERLDLAARACPLTTDQAVLEMSRMSVQLLATQLRHLAEGILGYERKLRELFDRHPDAKIFGSLPGAGPALAPRLLAAFGSNRNRYERAEEVQCFSGTAPVTERSGKTQFIHIRHRCPKFLRQTFHEFAGQSIRSCFWARAYYEQQRGKGMRHHAVLRSLAYKWIRILFRLWKDRKPYREDLYLEALRRRGSSLLAYAAEGATR